MELTSGGRVKERGAWPESSMAMVSHHLHETLSIATLWGQVPGTSQAPRSGGVHLAASLDL